MEEGEGKGGRGEERGKKEIKKKKESGGVWKGGDEGGGRGKGERLDGKIN